MSDKPINSANKEAILVALDQLSQTMEVMSQVVARLKRTVEQARFADQVDNPSERYSAEGLQDYYRGRRNKIANASADKVKEPTAKTPIIIH